MKTLLYNVRSTAAAGAYVDGEKGGQMVAYPVAPPRQLTLTPGEVNHVMTFTQGLSRLGE